MNNIKKYLSRTALVFLTFLTVSGLTYHFLLRSWCLHWGTTPAEAQAILPGDELFPKFSSEATHAITIHANAQHVWPWLMQIGQDRGGFYSYTFLENAIGCDMPRVERLVPEWQARAVGETVWFASPKRYGLQGRMIAAVVQPGHSFVMVTPADWERLQSGKPTQEGFWSFTLEPLNGSQTRLIARARGGEPPTFLSRAAGRLFWEPAHFVMEQKMLRKIRDLAENG